MKKKRKATKPFQLPHCKFVSSRSSVTRRSGEGEGGGEKEGVKGGRDEKRMGWGEG